MASDASSKTAASWIVRWGYPLLGCALLALYAPTLARGATFSDGPEITTAITTLGVAHPTGYPVFVVVAHFFTVLFFVPLPQVVKIELLNALFAAASSVLVARVAREIALVTTRRGYTTERHDADRAGLVAGALLGISPLLWQQVRIPEVYPFHVLLVTASLYLLVRFEITRRGGWVVAAALPMGVGLAHHVTMVYQLPATLIYLAIRSPSLVTAWVRAPIARVARWIRRKGDASTRVQGAWVIPVACLVGALPLLSYGYLLWANAHTSGVTWGDVHGWRELYDHVTGRQYQRFMGGAEMLTRWARVARVPGVFDTQFLPLGTALFAAGIASIVRRSLPLFALLLGVIALNVTHAAYYSVGDYANYYLPAVVPCAVLMGVGYAAVASFLRARADCIRPWHVVGAIGVAALSAAVALLGYGRFTKRLPPAISGHKVAYLTVPLAVFAFAALAAAVLAHRERLILPRAPASLPRIVLGAVLVITLLPVSVARAYGLATQPIVGENYGADAAQTLPRGAAFMTQGDGYLFTMWYEAHVLERAIDVATLDMGNLKTPWYQRYVRSHYPRSCDPLAPSFRADPAAYAARCGAFAKRIGLHDPDAWLSMGLNGPRRGAIVPIERPGATVVRGADAQCSEAAYRDQHRNECRCWDYSARRLELAEDCVDTVEEGGIVPRDAVEMRAQRIVEDELARRPVYERNMFTNWIGSVKDNPRGWSGPAYLRISADYALLNRGRVNQIVYEDEVEDLDACGRDALKPVPVSSRASMRGKRLAYRSNPWLTLLTATYLARTAGATDDDARRSFAPGDAVHMKLEWFERFEYDAAAADRRGKPIHHGVRICVFDPDGRRVETVTAVSGDTEEVELLRTDAGSKRGVYTVQACSVGETGGVPFSNDKPCARTLLEYMFTVEK